MSNCCNAFGIDLGTTNSVGCIYKAGKLEVLCSMNSERTFPSYVAFPSNGKPVFMVGRNAKNRMKSRAKEVIHDVKRLFGVEYDSDIVRNMKKSCAFEIDKDENGKPVVAYTQNGQRYTKYPQEISSYVLSDIAKSMKAFAGFDIKDVVITVPAYFDSYQRRLTEEAAKIAGLNVLEIITEPEAAAFAYSDINIHDSNERTLLIYDLGGGTFDVTIMKTDGLKFEELALDGDLLLGGSDFDTILMNEFIKDFEQETGDSFPKNRYGKLRADCEAAKIFLMSQTETTVECDGCDFEWTLTRARMESLLEGMIEKTLTICDRALKTAHLTKDKIDDIVFVGGSTRMLLVDNMVSKYYGKSIKKTINPDECVAYGAAKYALYLTLHPELMKPSSTNNETVDDINIDDIPDAPIIPDIVMDDESLNIAKEKVNEMEIKTICYGTVGIADARMRMNTLIRKGRQLPYSTSIELHNHEANITSLTIPVLLGEHSHARRNKIVKCVTITDIKPMPKGENSFYMFFDMDKHGSLSIRVIDNDTGKEMVIKDIQETMPGKSVDELQNDLQNDIKKNEMYTALETRKNEDNIRVYDLLRKKPEFTDQLEMIRDQLYKVQSYEELLNIEREIEVYQFVVCFIKFGILYPQTYRRLHYLQPKGSGGGREGTGPYSSTNRSLDGLEVFNSVDHGSVHAISLTVNNVLNKLRNILSQACRLATVPSSKGAKSNPLYRRCLGIIEKAINEEGKNDFHIWDEEEEVLYHYYYAIHCHCFDLVAAMQFYDRPGCSNDNIPCFQHNCAAGVYNPVVCRYTFPDHNIAKATTLIRNIGRFSTHFNQGSICRAGPFIAAYANELLYPSERYPAKDIVACVERYLKKSLSQQDQIIVSNLFQYHRSLGPGLFSHVPIEAGLEEKREYKTKRDPNGCVMENKTNLVEFEKSSPLPPDSTYAFDFIHGVANGIKRVMSYIRHSHVSKAAVCKKVKGIILSKRSGLSDVNELLPFFDSIPDSVTIEAYMLWRTRQ